MSYVIKMCYYFNRKPPTVIIVKFVCLHFVRNGKSKDDAVVKEIKAIDETKKSIEKVSAPVGTTLCLNCRRPSKHLCPHCKGMYFCELPRQCAQNGYVSIILSLIIFFHPHAYIHLYIHTLHI